VRQYDVKERHDVHNKLLKNDVIILNI